MTSLFDDIHTLTIDEKIEVAVRKVNAAIDKYKPIAVFGLLSGGNDSLPATYIASRSKTFTAAVHINTGFGVEATREFVRETCVEQAWKLLEYKSVENINAKGELDPQRYEDLVLKFGFPGPNGHQFMYHHLKDRQLERLERDFGAFSRYKIPKPVRKEWKARLNGKKKWASIMSQRLRDSGQLEQYFAGERVMYISGVRSQESQRRMGTTVPQKIDGRRVWVAPCHDWSQQDCADAREITGLRQNPVCELIGMSGECLCGAFAKPGELEILRGWPLTHPCYVRIMDLQQQVFAAGFTWGWGERPPKNWKPKKSQQFDLFESQMELCHNCIKHHGGRD